MIKNKRWNKYLTNLCAFVCVCVWRESGYESTRQRQESVKRISKPITTGNFTRERNGCNVKVRMGSKRHRIKEFGFCIQVWSKCDIREAGLMIWDKNPSGTTVMTLISRSRLIWTQPADTFAVINSHVVAECFVPWNWIVLLSDKGRTMFGY